jgi:RNA polymerase sigma-70 factor (ECF subfamily)
VDAALKNEESPSALLPTPASQAASELSAWVQRAQEGDASAFDELVRRTQGLVKKTAYPLLGPDQVEDALQESYLVVYQKLHHLRNPEAFQAWLVRIVLHVCYAIARKTPRLAASDTVEMSSQDDSIALTQRLDLKSALARLKEEERSTLILREMLGLSYEEIAYALRLPIGTVRSRLHYGRKRLVELLTSRT